MTGGVPNEGELVRKRLGQWLSWRLWSHWPPWRCLRVPRKPQLRHPRRGSSMRTVAALFTPDPRNAWIKKEFVQQWNAERDAERDAKREAMRRQATSTDEVTIMATAYLEDDNTKTISPGGNLTRLMLTSKTHWTTTCAAPVLLPGTPGPAGTAEILGTQTRLD